MDSTKLKNDPYTDITTHFSGGIIKQFSKNEVLIQSDEEPEGVYLIKTGFVKAYTIARTGQKNLLLIHGADEIMPLPWALDGAQKLGVFYEAMSDVTIISSSKDGLRKAMSSNAWLTEQILRQLIIVTSLIAS